MSLKWFDTHAHLSDAQFDADREGALLRSGESGVTRIVEIADGPLEWPKARELAERHQGMLWWAAGIHPYYAADGSDAVFNDLRALVSHPQFVAIGEVGLDYAKAQIPKEVQIETFKKALTLAGELDKPLIIHCRNAFEDLIPLLKNHLVSSASKQSPGVIHCFSGSTQEGNVLMEMGFYLGVDGPLTYPSAKTLRESFQSFPLDRIVLETDSPYLPPQTHRGKRNDPSYLSAVGAKLAEIREITLQEVAETTWQNGDKLFRLN